MGNLISEKETAKKLGILLPTVKRLVESGTLKYAKDDDKSFDEDAIQNLILARGKEQLITIDVVSELFKKADSTSFDPNISLSPLESLKKRAEYVNTDVMLVVDTFPVKGSPNRYTCLLPLRDYHSNSDAHAAAALALICTIQDAGGTINTFTCENPRDYLPYDPCNATIEKNKNQIIDNIMAFAHGWAHDYGKFQRNYKKQILDFLGGTKSSTKIGQCIVIDKVKLFPQDRYETEKRTDVFAYLTIPLFPNHKS